MELQIKDATAEIIWQYKHYLERGVIGFSKSLDKDMDLPESVLEKTHEAHYQVAEFTLIVMDAWKVR